MAFLGYTQKNASTLGNRLGGDIGQLLNGLAQQKAKQLKTTQNKQFLNSLGIHPQISSSLAHQSDDNIFNFLKQFEGFNIGAPGAQNPLDAMQSLNQNASQPNQQMMMPNQLNQQQQVAQNQPQADTNAILRGLTANPAASSQVSPEQIGQLLQNQATQNALNPFNNQQQQQVQQSPIRSKSKNIAEKQYEYNIQRDIDKFERPALEQAHKDYVTAQINDKILKMQMDLVEKGDLSNPIASSAVDKLNKGLFGISLDLSSLLTADSQEFQKLTAQMAENLRTSGAGRVTNLMMDNFMKSIPTLMQSDEGKKRVIENYKMFNDIKKSKYLIMKKLVDQNGGKTPQNLSFMASELEAQVLDKNLPQLKKFEQEFSQPVKNNPKQTYKTLEEAIEAGKRAGAVAVRDPKTGKVHKL